MRRTRPLALCLALATTLAHAVVVRGRVTSPLGQPLAGARIQLIQGKRSVADTISGPDGTYEIRTSFRGRFLLITSPSILAADYTPQVGRPFYAGRTDLVTIDIALNHAGITPQVSSQQLLVEKPNRQLAAPLTQIAADELLTQFSPIPELRSVPGSVMVQFGETGTPAFLSLRGAPPATLKTTVEGVTVNDLGEGFNLARISTTGSDAVSPDSAYEITPVANPLYLTGAAGGVLTIAPAQAEVLRPTLTYTGAAGNLGAYRNEAVATWARSRLDLLGAFGRFDIANDEPAMPYHIATFAANVGYRISAGTSLRVTARNDFSAGGLPNPYQFFLVELRGREASQDLVTTAAFDTRTSAGWHNLVRYGLVRNRTQVFGYATPAFGLPVTITGANGYAASGMAAFIPLPAREDAVTDRDEATWQSDYAVRPWLGMVGEFRFQQERAADMLPTSKQTVTRNHLSGALGFHGDIRHRFFYEASGFVDHSEALGLTGSPRLGLTYVPVRPGLRRFRGTSLHATAATGVREPSLLENAASPNLLTSPRSRTFDLSVDQNILAEKLTLRASYFHDQFSHEFEPIALAALEPFRSALSQTLALRTQGFESDLRYQPFQRVLLEAGYNYLAALTEQSAEVASTNTGFPKIAIGGLTALAGQRPFHRPPQSGNLRAEYSGTHLNASIQGSIVSRSDDSTGLVQSPDLLLPNRNLSPGYTSLDAQVSAVISRHLTFISQFANLTDNRHLAPIGYLSMPFLVQSGLRIRFGRD